MRWVMKDRAKWRPWFAWYPVVVMGIWVWLEWVERQRCESIGGEWTDYRNPQRHD